MIYIIPKLFIGNYLKIRNRKGFWNYIYLLLCKHTYFLVLQNRLKKKKKKITRHTALQSIE